MNPEQLILRDKFSALLKWEKVKRREQLVVSIFCYGLLASLVALPFVILLPAWFDPLSLPLVFCLTAAPFVYLKRAWRPTESARAVALMDKTLHLDERALTAWEIVARADELKPTEGLVVKEAGERLRGVDPETLFRRQLNWQAYAVAPLLLLWLGFFWLDTGARTGGGVKPPSVKSIAQKLDEFSRELQEKAKTEGLQQSLKVSREMEKTAQKRIGEETDDKLFKEDLGAIAKRIEAMNQANSTGETSLSAGETQSGLRDLRAEMEAFRDTLDLPAGSEHGFGRKLSERLDALPRLKREMAKGLPSTEQLGENALRAFLDKMEQEVTKELDRRTLLEAQQFLENLLKEGDQTGQGRFRVAGRPESGVPAEAEKKEGTSSLPGDERGSKTGAPQALPPFRPGAAAHLKGLLAEGKSGGLVLRGRPSETKSELSQEEVLASYARQAEAEMNAERVPERLKAAIRNYFLSLGTAEDPGARSAER